MYMYMVTICLHPCMMYAALTHTHSHTHTQLFMTRLMELAALESGTRLHYSKKELALECIVQVRVG